VSRNYESLTRINDSSFSAHRLALYNGTFAEIAVYEPKSDRGRTS